MCCCLRQLLAFAVSRSALSCAGCCGAAGAPRCAAAGQLQLVSPDKLVSHSSCWSLLVLIILWNI